MVASFVVNDKGVGIVQRETRSCAAHGDSGVGGGQGGTMPAPPVRWTCPCGLSTAVLAKPGAPTLPDRDDGDA